MSNRAQRRAIARMSKARRPGESFADAIGTKQMIRKEVIRNTHDESVRLEAEIITQRFLWEAVVALNETFGFGQERAVRFMESIDKVLHDVEQMALDHGKEYAFEKLRQRASQITGMDIKYIHEDEMRQARRENEAKGIFFPEDREEDL